MFLKRFITLYSIEYKLTIQYMECQLKKRLEKKVTKKRKSRKDLGDYFKPIFTIFFQKEFFPDRNF